jgi:hypothetical protein
VVARALAVLLSLGASLGACLGLTACSGKPRAEEAAHSVAVRGDAAPPGDAAAAHPATGDLQIRVEWPDVPVAARSSPGRTPCNTPRTPSVAPTTTWGVPDALVVIDGATPLLAGAHVTLADCTITPRLTIGTTLAITSAVDRPARLVLRKRGTVATLGHLEPGDPIPVMLPIAGHSVTAALDAGAIYALETDAADPEVAFLAAVPSGYVTDAGGQIIARGLAVGAHAVTAWLPPRAGQPARIGRGSATVTDGDLAQLTVTLAP